MTDLEMRFWSKVRIGDGCWEWTGKLNNCGYGCFQCDGKSRGAHRMAWLLSHGAIPDGLLVCHRCDNRKCVKRSHLFLGTPQDNMDDKMAKGRHWHCPGSINPRAKLTESDVEDIRRLSASGATGVSLARRFGVSPQTVSDVVLRRSWAHVGGGQ